MKDDLEEFYNSEFQGYDVFKFSELTPEDKRGLRGSLMYQRWKLSKEIAKAEASISKFREGVYSFLKRFIK